MSNLFAVLALCLGILFAQGAHAETLLNRDRPPGLKIPDAPRAGPSFDVDRATDVLWTLNHPDTWYLLVRRCGWTADQYEQWVGDTLAAQLLAS